MDNPKLILIAHNIRSCHNIGSLLRTADGIGVETVYLTGYTPFPKLQSDPRMPHEATSVEKRINKTALGAQNYINWEYSKNIKPITDELKSNDFHIAALEQTDSSIDIAAFAPPKKLALIVGSELNGLDRSVLNLCDTTLEIPMRGKKESFNVSVAAAIALHAISLKYKML